MQILFELNQKHGKGYQVHYVEGPISKTYDEDSMTLYEAGQLAQMIVDAVNDQQNSSIQPNEVVRITDEALEANQSYDLASRKIFQDLHDGTGKYAYPAKADYKVEMIDGQEQELLSGRGIVLLAYYAWKDDKLPKAKLVVQRFCQLLAGHGYVSDAAEIFKELDALDKRPGAEWIKAKYGRFIHNDWEVADLLSD